MGEIFPGTAVFGARGDLSRSSAEYEFRSMSSPMRKKGKVTSWNDEKGFGFVTPFDGSKPIFIHIKAIRTRTRRPVVDDVVTFSIGQDKQGRPRATDAVLAGERKPNSRALGQRNMVTIAFAVLFLAVVGTSVALKEIPLVVGIGYALLSLVTFGAYAWDKSSARTGAWRTAERSLHLLGLAGGWPGALIAQQTLRHKSKKDSFVIVLWATVLINGGAFVWLHTESGQAALQAFLAQVIPAAALVDLA